MKRPIYLISTIFVTLLSYSIDVFASVLDTPSDIVSNSGIYQPFIDTNNLSTMPILLAGKTKTTVKTKTKTKTVDDEGNVTKTKVKTKTTTTTTSSEDTSDNSDQSSGSGGYTGASYEGE
ncbi:MAG: hypothetical protein KZQ82_20475 [Candidatus Thiodiazotropha sp. (ex Lucinoma annulata)]|nr:hypothetical protein [Candidatus Thiodiazotropha sp. (ex Lucinoma borealis)]MCU7856502.1 hypothetical protein [Candidatus Thiodiazotropha sp. (ex Lucinoma borealis)]MCU7862360.1 hypothetical protein [Candidatus Thiodiazotropha sp. (ex Lucinoma borealis)]MCU7866996.1 hypothetical protein [Candidatus Thiodiazotropha sp. (ex Lucinoma borealis)]MCU7886572.1 hypothetical protein [Candidatus Thiodiazotropha sp. (ex Lucinoma annulata)]